jgi:hypothetical protein
MAWRPHLTARSVAAFSRCCVFIMVQATTMSYGVIENVITTHSKYKYSRNQVTNEFRTTGSEF